MLFIPYVGLFILIPSPSLNFEKFQSHHRSYHYLGKLNLETNEPLSSLSLSRVSSNLSLHCSTNYIPYLDEKDELDMK